MIIHIFNSALVSGPETLVLPALRQLTEPVEIVFLSETRRGKDAKRPVDYARSLGHAVTEIAVSSRVDFKAVHALRDHLLKRSPSIVHAHDVKASTYAYFASRISRSWKLVSTHHSVKRAGLKLKAYERFYSSFILRKFDLALSVSNEDRDILVQRGFPPDRIIAHLNGVDRRKVAIENRADERTRIHEKWKLSARGIGPRSLVMGIAARLDPEKNHSEALDVMAALRDFDPTLDWHLLCFGVGGLQAKLESKTRALGLEKRVHWMGYYAGLGDEFAGLDLLLSFSKAEGLPINVLEAGWAGTPIATTPEGGIKDVIQEPTQGALLTSPINAEQAAATVSEILKNQSFREDLGRGLQRRVIDAFSQASWINQLQVIYSKLNTNTHN